MTRHITHSFNYRIQLNKTNSIFKVTNPMLIDLIRRKVKLNQPYAGIFLKKNDDNESEVVESLADIYEIGTFAQIQEMQDLGDKLRLVTTAHRRVKITKQLFEDLEPPSKKNGKRHQCLYLYSLYNEWHTLNIAINPFLYAPNACNLAAKRSSLIQVSLLL